jgi:hypothetical protein
MVEETTARVIRVRARKIITGGERTMNLADRKAVVERLVTATRDLAGRRTRADLTLWRGPDEGGAPEGKMTQAELQARLAAMAPLVRRLVEAVLLNSNRRLKRRR